jgi:hypothetical protein
MTSTRTVAVLCATLAVTFGVLVPQASARDDVSCGSRCDNENPQTFVVTPPGGPSNWYHCGADARTVDSIGPADDSGLAQFGVTIQLRYSPKCRTVWARAFGLQRSDTLWVMRNPNTSYTDISDDVEYPYNSDYVGGTNWMWSKMLNDAGQRSVACFTPRGHGAGRLHYCTRHPY